MGPAESASEHWQRDEVTARSAIVILAAGQGTRMRGRTYSGIGTKAFYPLADVPVVAWSLLAAATVPQVNHVVVVIRPEDRGRMREIVAEYASGTKVDLIAGGASRHESEMAALRHLAEPIQAGNIDVVVIHDGARPLALPGLFRRVIATAQRHGGAIPAIPLEGVFGDERALVRVQTPQAFRARKLLAAYMDAAHDGYQGTDTSACMQRYSGLPIRTVPGALTNIKLTYGEDVDLAENLVSASRNNHTTSAPQQRDPEPYSGATNPPRYLQAEPPPPPPPGSGQFAAPATSGQFARPAQSGEFASPGSGQFATPGTTSGQFAAAASGQFALPPEAGEFNSPGTGQFAAPSSQKFAIPEPSDQLPIPVAEQLEPDAPQHATRPYAARSHVSLIRTDGGPPPPPQGAHRFPNPHTPPIQVDLLNPPPEIHLPAEDNSQAQ